MDDWKEGNNILFGLNVGGIISFCSCKGWFESDLVETPKTGFLMSRPILCSY